MHNKNPEKSDQKSELIYLLKINYGKLLIKKRTKMKNQKA